MPKKYKDIYDALLKNSRANGECLESTYKKDSHRHPMMTYRKKAYTVHRASWEYHNGKIPEGMLVCHKCDNPRCFRIEHLFLGTHKDNVQDMITKGRDNNWGARKYSAQQWEKAETLRREGYTNFQIAERLDMRYPAVAAHMVRHKISKGTPKRKDRKIPNSIIDIILSLRNQGWLDSHIYRHLGISESTFYLRVKEHEQRTLKGI